MPHFLFLFLCIAFSTSQTVSQRTVNDLPVTKHGTFGFCELPADATKGAVNLNLIVASSNVPNATKSHCYQMTETNSPLFHLCMYPPQEDLISRFINESGTWEYIKTKMLSIFFKEQMQRPNPRNLMLDLGANQGYFGFIAASHGYQVIMVEPSPKTSDLLRQTVIKNKWQRKITVFRNAVGNKRELLQFNFAEGNSGSSTVSPNAAGDTHCVLPDDLLTNLKFDPTKLFMLKIDVEGLDFEVLDGARNIIQYGRPPLIMVEAPAGTRCDQTKVLTTLYNAGYVAINDLQPSVKLSLEQLIADVAERKLPDLIFLDAQKHQEMAGHIDDTYNYKAQ